MTFGIPCVHVAFHVSPGTAGAYYVEPENVSRLPRTKAPAMSRLRREAAPRGLRRNEHHRLQTVQRNRPDRVPDLPRGWPGLVAPSGISVGLIHPDARGIMRRVLAGRVGQVGRRGAGRPQEMRDYTVCWSACHASSGSMARAALVGPISRWSSP